MTFIYHVYKCVDTELEIHPNNLQTNVTLIMFPREEKDSLKYRSP